MFQKIAMHRSMLSPLPSCMARKTIGIARGLALFIISMIIVPLSVSGLSMLRVASWVSHFFSTQKSCLVWIESNFTSQVSQVSHVSPCLPSCQFTYSATPTKKNLLAQDYVKEYKYPWTRQNPGCLDWDHRKALIADQLLDKDFKADIVCLQEAQVDLFGELLSSLSPVYDGVLQNVTRGHNVGKSGDCISNGNLIPNKLFHSPVS